jgi:hypothetical protein
MARAKTSLKAMLKVTKRRFQKDVKGAVNFMDML